MVLSNSIGHLHSKCFLFGCDIKINDFVFSIVLFDGVDDVSFHDFGTAQTFDTLPWFTLKMTIVNWVQLRLQMEPMGYDEESAFHSITADRIYDLNRFRLFLNQKYYLNYMELGC